MFNVKNSSFKWLADKIDTDLKEVRLNFDYFRQNVQNIPFALIQLDIDSIQNEESVSYFKVKKKKSF
jgi:hypothetical protein